MTTYTDLYSTTNWRDGQEVRLDALISDARSPRAQMTDQILQQLIGDVSNTATRPDFGADGGADASTLWAYCVSPGRAFLRQGSANNKIQLAPGTLLQKIANADGNDSTLVPFTFAGTEEWALTNGDATNPRVDLLQMSLAYITDTPANTDFEDAVTRAKSTDAAGNTRRRVQATLTVKQGTPAASPVIPDPDAGCVPVGTVVVGHGWTTGGNAPIFGVDTADANNVVVHDQRMPIGVLALVVEPVTYKRTNWALAADSTSVATTNATNALFIRCPTKIGRVLAVDLEDTGTGYAPSGSVSLGQDVRGTAGTFVPGNGFGVNRGGPTFTRSRRRDFEALHTPAAGPTILPSSVNKIGVPLWASGYRTPQVDANVGISGFAHIRVNNANNAPQTFYEAVFYVAA